MQTIANRRSLFTEILTSIISILIYFDFGQRNQSFSNFSTIRFCSPFLIILFQCKIEYKKKILVTGNDKFNHSNFHAIKPEPK